MPEQISATYTGSVTINADLTYTSTLASAGTDTAAFPAACLTSGGVTFTCATFAQEYQVVDPTATCTASSGGGCSCQGTFSNSATTETGTYTISGDVITKTASDGTVTQVPYCVSGNTLTVSPLFSSTSGSTGTQSGSIVYTKQ